MRRSSAGRPCVRATSPRRRLLVLRRLKARTRQARSPQRRRETRVVSGQPYGEAARRPAFSREHCGDGLERSGDIAIREERRTLRKKRRVIWAAKRAEHPAAREKLADSRGLLGLEVRVRGADDERPLPLRERAIARESEPGSHLAPQRCLERSSRVRELLDWRGARWREIHDARLTLEPGQGRTDVGDRRSGDLHREIARGAIVKPSARDRPGETRAESARPP